MTAGEAKVWIAVRLEESAQAAARLLGHLRAGITPTFPALTIHEPWATMIARQIKDVENRTWETKYRGPVAIHAGLHWNAKDVGETLDWLMRNELLTLCDRPTFAELQCNLGHIIAVAELTGCSVNHPSPWYQPGSWAFVLANVRQLASPIPVTGKRGLFDLPRDACHQIGQQLGGPPTASILAIEELTGKRIEIWPDIREGLRLIGQLCACALGQQQQSTLPAIDDDSTAASIARIEAIEQLTGKRVTTKRDVRDMLVLLARACAIASEQLANAPGAS